MSGTDLEEDLPAAVKSQDRAKASRGITRCPTQLKENPTQRQAGTAVHENILQVENNTCEA